MIANYHTHTAFCKHATGTEREYVEHAIKAGIKVLGFSDHAPQLFTDGHISGIRMDPKKAPEYASRLQALKEEYKNDIEIHIGFESEYYPEIFASFQDLCRSNNIEYLILGQHSIGTDGAPGSVWSRLATESEDLLVQYTDYVIGGIKTGSFSYIAHPDLINYTGDKKIYQREMERLCIAAKSSNLPLEYNLLGVWDNRHYPKKEFWEIAKSTGNDVIIGCDAHSPDALCKIDVQNKAADYLLNMGFNIVQNLKFNKI